MKDGELHRERYESKHNFRVGLDYFGYYIIVKV